ncbi:MAG: transglycosylase SLT domain-containing protein [Geminicoccaceae bacterium]
MRNWAWLAVLLCLCPFWAWAAITQDADLCAGAIAQAEASRVLPGGLLTAVAVAESGRYDRGRRGVAPWPWTVNNGGDGRYFGSKEEAIAHVERLRAAGERNIDVGCMQISLLHHPEAFASLDEAFEPGANVAYGARYLRALEQETRSWDRAVERYHTADPERGRAYRERVYQRWAGASATAGQPASTSGQTAEPIVVASAAAEEPSRDLGGLRRLRPVRELNLDASRSAGTGIRTGYLNLRGTDSRVAVLRPAADRQLRPIVRPPRRSSVGLVRLSGSRRTLAFLGP